MQDVQGSPHAYQDRIVGQPGEGAVALLRFVAIVVLLGGLVAALLLLEDSLEVAAVLAVGAVAQALVLHGFAVVIENIIAIRLELEFQSEVVEAGGLEGLHEEPDPSP